MSAAIGSRTVKCVDIEKLFQTQKVAEPIDTIVRLFLSLGYRCHATERDIVIQDINGQLHVIQYAKDL